MSDKPLLEQPEAGAITLSPDTPLAQPSPMQIIAQIASEESCDVEKLTALVDLQERMAATEARREWHEAVVTFQEKCPVVVKSSKGHTAKYAKYEQIMDVAQPVLTECGLSVTFGHEGIEEGSVRVVCHIAHGTHVETRGITCPIPEEIISKRSGGSVANSAQRLGMAISYAKRYALCAALNIVVVGEDFDGRAPNPAPDADPDAPRAATRGQRSDITDLSVRWAKVKGVSTEPWTNKDADAWWKWVFGTDVLNCANKLAVDLTDADLDKISVRIGEIEGAGR